MPANILHHVDTAAHTSGNDVLSSTSPVNVCHSLMNCLYCPVLVQVSSSGVSKRSTFHTCQLFFHPTVIVLGYCVTVHCTTVVQVLNDLELLFVPYRPLLLNHTPREVFIIKQT